MLTVVVVIADGSGGLVLPLIVLVVVVVVATDKHITLLFKTRSGIKHNAERCSDVSPRSAFCFGRLFLTTHAFRVLVLVLSRETCPFFPFLPFFLPSSSSLSLRLRLLLCRLFLLAAPFCPFFTLPLVPRRSLSLDTVYKPQPTPSSRRAFFESYCTMRFEWEAGGREEGGRERGRVSNPIVVSPMAADFIVI